MLSMEKGRAPLLGSAAPAAFLSADGRKGWKRRGGEGSDGCGEPAADDEAAAAAGDPMGDLAKAEDVEAGEEAHEVVVGGAGWGESVILISGLSVLSTLILSAMAVSGLVGSTTSMFRTKCGPSSGLVGVSSTSSLTGPPPGGVAAVATAHSVIARPAVLFSRSSHKMIRQ